MANTRVIRNYKDSNLPIHERVRKLSTQIDFMEQVSKLSFMSGTDTPPVLICTNFDGCYKIKQSDDERFYLEHRGAIILIVLEFCYELGGYKLYHNYLDLPVIENPTISQVTDYYYKHLDNIISELRQESINEELAYERSLEEKRIKRENEPCTIYIALDTTCGFHKIGRSKNVAAREQVLMAQKPTIKVVAQFDGIAIDESKLHYLLKDAGYHIRGEWFNLNKPESLSIIQNYFKNK